MSNIATLSSYALHEYNSDTLSADHLERSGQVEGFAQTYHKILSLITQIPLIASIVAAVERALFTNESLDDSSDSLNENDVVFAVDNGSNKDYDGMLKF